MTPYDRLMIFDTLLGCIGMLCVLNGNASKGAKNFAAVMFAVLMVFGAVFGHALVG